MEFGTRIIHIADKSIKLQIWDTAGQVIGSNTECINIHGLTRIKRNDLDHLQRVTFVVQLVHL
jgi:GTPase SAR1 family protein